MLSPETRPASEALLDTLVDVGEPCFETQDLLADDLEPEVSRFDDARMHRSDRDLVHTIAADTHERIILLAGPPLRRDFEVAPQRELVDRPRRLPQPGPLVVGVALNAQNVEIRALHAVRCREDRRQVRIARLAVGQRVLEQRQSVGVHEQDAQAKASPTIALVAPPQRDELPAFLPSQAARGQKLSRAHRAALRRNGRGERCGGDS